MLPYSWSFYIDGSLKRFIQLNQLCLRIQFFKECSIKQANKSEYEPITVDFTTVLKHVNRILSVMNRLDTRSLQIN